MRIWISGSFTRGLVWLHHKKPKFEASCGWSKKDGYCMCGDVAERLIRGSGKKLPEHGTDDLVSVIISAKRGKNVNKRARREIVYG